MLSLTDIAAMQAEMIKSFPATATVLRSTSAPDGMGGKIDVWAAATVPAYPNGYPASVMPFPVRAGAESAATGKLLATTDFHIYLPAQADVTAKDRVAASGTTYEVQDVESGESDMICLVAHCARIS